VSTASRDILRNLLVWRSAARTDAYMAGVIRAGFWTRDGVRTRSCECGGAFVPRKRRDFQNEIPVCESCGDTPSSYVIRVTLPGMPKKDLYYSLDGERLTTASLADQTLQRIRKSIADRTFDPLMYLGRGQKEEYRFRNFAEFYIKTRKEDLEAPLTPSGEHNIRTVLKNYLNPAFGETFVPEITTGAIKRFEVTWKPVGEAKTTRQRDASLEVLRSVLIFAKRLEIVKALPEFPRIAKSKRATARIGLEEQDLVLARMRDPFRAAAEVMRLTGARPSEMQALQWRDVDFAGRVLHIRRHFSRGEELGGRKSIADRSNPLYDHRHELTEAIAAILRRMPRQLAPDAYVFVRQHGRRLERMGLGAIYRDWCRAREEVNEERRRQRLPAITIDLYRGIKSSTATILRKGGMAKGDLTVLLGHGDAGSTDHYVDESGTLVTGVAEGVLVKMRSKKAPDSERL
jgi:integrase